MFTREAKPKKPNKAIIKKSLFFGRENGVSRLFLCKKGGGILAKREDSGAILQIFLYKPGGRIYNKKLCAVCLVPQDKMPAEFF